MIMCMVPPAELNISTAERISEIRQKMVVLMREFSETEEPICLTKNASGAPVSVGSGAFSREAPLHCSLLEREERVCRAITRGREDELEGRVRSLGEARCDAETLRNLS